MVLLDLRRNKYLGVAGRRLAGLAHLVEGWPAAPQASMAAVPPSDIDAATDLLVSEGLLTRYTIDLPQAPTIDEAAQALAADDVIDDAVLGLRRACHVLHSAAVAALWLRVRSLHWIAEAVATRRARHQPVTTEPAPITAVRAAVAAHLKLRPFVYTAQDRCLLDSLSLVGYLAHEGVFPRWVIGVKTHPFAAHSWVQDGAVVLNDSPERVRAYQPILVV